MKLLVDSNPVPNISVVDRLEIQSTARLANLDRRRSEMTELKERNQDATSGWAPHKVAIGAVALVGIVVVALALMIGSASEPPVADANLSPAETADAFLRAYEMTSDLDTAFSYLARGATWDGVPIARGPEELMAEYRQAIGSKKTSLSCRESATPPSGGRVICRSEGHSLRSDEIGLGPYPGVYAITVHDGKVTSVEDIYEPPAEGDPFTNEMWAPFRTWMVENHRDDVEVMYDGFGWRITEESIPLWEQRTREYAEEMAPS
jgi:hypothetical protein